MQIKLFILVGKLYFGTIFLYDSVFDCWLVGLFRKNAHIELCVTHSRTASAVMPLSYCGSFFIGVHGPDSILGLCGTRTQTDGTGAV